MNTTAADQPQLSILHVVLHTDATCPVYNEHCLPVADKRQLTLCTYFSSPTTPPPNIRLITGNGTIGGFVGAFRKAIKERDYDIIHLHSPHFGMFLPLLALLEPKLLRKTISTIHDSYPNFKLKNKLYLVPVFAFSRRVIGCGQASYDSFPPFFRMLAGKRLCAAPNGVDIERIDRILAKTATTEDQDSESKVRDRFVAINISRLVKVKALGVTIEAFQRLAQSVNNSAASEKEPDCHLTVVGVGPLGETLSKSVHAMQLDEQVEFTGLIPRDDVYRRLQDADVYISTSLGEGLPVAGLEAMACGCPAILSDIPPHRELADQVQGIELVATNDVEGFAGALKRFKQLSGEERSRIGQRCRQLVEEKFSLSAMHRNYENLYRQVKRENNKRGNRGWAPLLQAKK